MPSPTPLSNDELIAKATLLLQEVETAFESVERGSSIGLHETDLHDYGTFPVTDDAIRSARSKDNYERWQEIEIPYEFRFGNILSLMDEHAFKFHIPAYITTDLQEFIDGVESKNPIDIDFHLTDRVLRPDHRLTTFDRAQVRCCGLYVELCAERMAHQDRPIDADRLDALKRFNIPLITRLVKNVENAPASWAEHIKALERFYLPFLNEDEAARIKQRWLT